MAVTIHDIAKSANVSKSTVSRVLSKSGYVSADAREKVEKAIKELNFVPSAVARGLSKKESNTIGVLVPEIDNNFFTEVLSGVSDILDSLEMTLLLSDTANSAVKQARALQMLRSQQVRGLIITPALEFHDRSNNEEFISQLQALNMPIVVVDREIPDSIWDSIIYENFNAGYQAARLMIDRGRKNLGIITGDMNLAIARDRFKGFMSAMEEAGLDVPEENILQGDFTIETAAKLSTENFDSRISQLEGLVCSNNLTSIGLMQVLRSRNLEPGSELGVVGIDAVRCFRNLGIPFTHIDRDLRLTGKKAVEMLLDRIENPEREKETFLVPAEVVIQGTE